MQAPIKGNGHDFNPAAPYGMYQGDRIPGFPQVMAMNRKIYYLEL
jgi:hypothetical protein